MSSQVIPQANYPAGMELFFARELWRRPTILMRSGIGPRDELARHKIDVRCEHASIGKNLQDHLIMPVIFETKSTNVFSFNASVRDTARWQALGTGPIGSNIAECGGLFNRGKVQIHITPTNYLTFPHKSVTSVMTVGVNLTQPRSRGTVTIASKDLRIPPCIHPNYLAEESDLEGTIRAVELARRIAFEHVLCRAGSRARCCLVPSEQVTLRLPSPSLVTRRLSITRSALVGWVVKLIRWLIQTLHCGAQRGFGLLMHRSYHDSPKGTQTPPIMTLATLAADSVKLQIETSED